MGYFFNQIAKDEGAAESQNKFHFNSDELYITARQILQ